MNDLQCEYIGINHFESISQLNCLNPVLMRAMMEYKADDRTVPNSFEYRIFHSSLIHGVMVPLGKVTVCVAALWRWACLSPQHTPTTIEPERGEQLFVCMIQKYETLLY